MASGVRAFTVGGVDLKDDGSTDYEITLDGEADEQFIPLRYAVRIDDGVLLQGDAEISVGTTAGDDDVLATTDGIQASAVGSVCSPEFGWGNVVPLIAGDDTLHIMVSSADSGTSGEATFMVMGAFI